MKILYIIFLLFFVMSACSQSEKELNYTLVEDDDGILVEEFDSINKDENRYTANNEIFREKTAFKYSFYHLNKKGEKQFIKYVDSLDNWQFVNEFEIDDFTMKEVVITVEYGLAPFIDFLPDYNQTVISFEYPVSAGNSRFSSQSGVIENAGNIWMHPPRDKYFEILEINPFPYIKAPFKEGNKWRWHLTIGDNWSDPRWKSWKGRIENQYQYEITDRREIDTKLGDIECYVVESTAISRIGKTGLISYFNEEKGFVKLEYSNIDGSKTVLELVEVIAPEL